MVVIALTSKRGRSGKDTLVELLKERGHEVYRVAFGDVLKRQCSAVVTDEECARIVMESHFHSDMKDAAFEELSIDALPDSPYKDWLLEAPLLFDVTLPRTPRWHLQQYGTGYRRVHQNNPDVWLHEGLIEITKAPEGSLVVVTDMRQENEYQALSRMGAHLVRLHRNWYIPAVDDAPLHATDIELEDFGMDAFITNVWGDRENMITQLIEKGVLE